MKIGEATTDCNLFCCSARSPGRYLHNRFFNLLDGAHVSVECAEYHKGNTYKGTSSECAACHAAPDYHRGLFMRQTCLACNTTAAWRPAPYNGPHLFPMNHGEDHGNVNTLRRLSPTHLGQWACYRCHDRAKVEQERKENIADFSNSLRCHATGEKEDGDGGDDD